VVDSGTQAGIQVPVGVLRSMTSAFVCSIYTYEKCRN
jgi:hypothetical protein